jgi:hypothetical protein
MGDWHFEFDGNMGSNLINIDSALGGECEGHEHKNY